MHGEGPCKERADGERVLAALQIYQERPQKHTKVASVVRLPAALCVWG